MPPIFYLAIVGLAVVIRRNRKRETAPAPAPSPGGPDPEVARLTRQNERLKRALARKAAKPPGTPPEEIPPVLET